MHWLKQKSRINVWRLGQTDNTPEREGGSFGRMVESRLWSEGWCRNFRKLVISRYGQAYVSQHEIVNCGDRFFIWYPLILLGWIEAYVYMYDGHVPFVPSFAKTNKEIIEYTLLRFSFYNSKKRKNEKNRRNHDKRELHWEPEGGLGFRAVEASALWLSSSDLHYAEWARDGRTNQPSLEPLFKLNLWCELYRTDNGL